MIRDAHEPGWDATAVADIARTKYGGFERLFEDHGRPERGSDMMRKVQSRAAEAHGRVRAFMERHR